MHLNHRRGYQNLKNHDAECRPSYCADRASLATLADADCDSDQMTEQQEGDYPVRHLDVERSAALSDRPAPGKSLTRHCRSRHVGGEGAEDQCEKRDSNRRSARPEGTLVASRNGAGAKPTR